RPPTASDNWDGIRFPPHTRGSTWSAALRATPPRVSPAYAGIDPLSLLQEALHLGFPRIRGDRPGARGSPLPLPEFPPHTRGSTAVYFRALGTEGVSPAYAGIDRRAAPPGTDRSRFPRIRGDRPVAALLSRGLDVFPPHTRGSTRPIAAVGHVDSVSPA